MGNILLMHLILFSIYFKKTFLMIVCHISINESIESKTISKRILRETNCVSTSKTKYQPNNF